MLLINILKEELNWWGREKEAIGFKWQVIDEKVFTIRVVSVNRQQEAGL